jgi:hypothetical protein
MTEDRVLEYKFYFGPQVLKSVAVIDVLWQDRTVYMLQLRSFALSV